MGEYFGRVFFPRPLMISQKDHADPDSIKLPDSSTDNDDESYESENLGEAGDRSQQKEVADTVEAFIKHKISERGLLRRRNVILRAMCELNHLGVGRSKEELAQLLIDWVSVDAISYPEAFSQVVPASVKPPKSAGP